jgi:membrane dipeptidase
MDRRNCLKLLAATPLAVAAVPGGSGYTDADFASAIVIDGQGSLSDPYSDEPETRLSARAVAEMRQSGGTAFSMTVNEVGNDPDVWNATIRNIATFDQIVTDNPDALLKVSDARDIRRAKAEGREGFIYNLQDTSLVGADLDRLKLLKGLGVRVVQLTYNNRNLSGDGCLEPANAGLSKLGRATIARIEAEKLLLDLSHSGQRTTAEGIAAATRPMTISHTGCRALNDNPRNQWDAELKACADKGGVVGIYWMPFLAPDSHATSAHLLAHVEHAANLCGEDHVAIGTDNMLFKTVVNAKARAEARKVHERRSAAGVAAPGEGPDVFTIVWDWDGHMRFRRLADGLAMRGWSAARIDKLLGGNLLRLYGEVWG